MRISHRHFMLYKPYGYVSQFVSRQKGRKKKFLGSFHPFPENTMSIGRLDEKSEGLLLLTTNGKVSAQIRSKTVEKEYYVQLDGVISQCAIDQLNNGVEITVNKETYKTQPAFARRLVPTPLFPERSRPIRDDRHGPTSWISLTITEGKFRQVRKMTYVVGFPTLRLIRVRIGKLTIGDLKPGDVRELESFF